MLNVLALNAFHGGSHRAFLQGWQGHSQHEWATLSLPASHWKWRMRHAAVTFAEQTAELVRRGEQFDAIFCTDMLNLAEFRGLCVSEIRALPTVVYFHENQLTYPVQTPDERDLHFAFTNLTTALAADAVWWNSAFHRDEFLTALETTLRRLPDFAPRSAPDVIAAKSSVQSPGIASFQPRANREPGALRIVWVSRWEHDKQPEVFFEALRLLQLAGVRFEVAVLGEGYRTQPACFETARDEFSDEITEWGFQESVERYRDILSVADVVVSTAAHEFFGIAVTEAVAAGCVPCVPRALAYPEVLGACAGYFHQGLAASVAARLEQWAKCVEEHPAVTLFAQNSPGDELVIDPRLPGELNERHGWQATVLRLDGALTKVNTLQIP